MLKVSNGKCIRHLGLRSMQANRTRNSIAVLAIALTTVLFTFGQGVRTMLKVSNGKCIRHLGLRSMQANRTRNSIAVLAIALTTVLFTSLFTIAMSINEGFQQSNFRQCGGWSHASFKYLTEAQYEELKNDPLVEKQGVRRFIGMPGEAPFNKSIWDCAPCRQTAPETALQCLRLR